MERWHTIIEPFRIKSVEPIRMTTVDERDGYLRAAGYNLFNLHADDVLIDLLTDSGTGAMSAEQWAGIQRGDESYAGSPSWFRFLDAVTELWPFRHVIPTHQGRAAEKILFSVIGGPGKVVPSNTHFDTTRANVEFTGAEAVDLVIAEGRSPSAEHPFKGNMDTDALDALIRERGAGRGPGRLHDRDEQLRRRPARVARQPPRRSRGLRPVRAAAVHRRLPLRRERLVHQAAGGRLRRCVDPRHRPRDGGAGRWDDDVRQEGCARQHRRLAGDERRRAGRAVPEHAHPDRGLPDLRRPRRPGPRGDGRRPAGGRVTRTTCAIGSARPPTSGEALLESGIPCVRPIGGHAVYIDAAALLPHIPPLEYPGQALACALYREGGIRGCEIGTVMFGQRPDGSESPAAMELVRLAIPRRVYTQSHIDFVIEVIRRVAERATDLRGMRIVEQPATLRHFTARFEPIA